ncbi:MAG: YggS family pyridoxal phosphate-dependent enzyme [Sedimentisphaerales bacterium]|nr:YggS family pyridoxal phosphate-dependent enzyme [Sedimentisphaerales bacterium]
MKKRIADNLQRIRDNVAEACLRKNRDPNEVRIVAVSKTVDVDAILSLLELGHLELGESQVQQLIQRDARIRETLARQRELHSTPESQALPRPHWHMIGHLQRNKVKQVLPLVDMIHSVDSLRLAEEINTGVAKSGLAHKAKILLQVNTSQEKQKFGLAVGAVSALAEQIKTLPNLEIAGLMTMAPLTDDAEISRFCFGRLREIFEEMRGERIVGPECTHLSMGMSQDYIAAVEEGATILRIGSALFS